MKPHTTPSPVARFEGSLALLDRADLIALSRRCLDLATPPAPAIDAAGDVPTEGQPAWNVLPARVTIATARGSESFCLSWPLFRRLRALAAAGCSDLIGITEGGRAMTAASVSALSLYLTAGGESALARATKSHPGTAAQWLELTRRVIRCEFTR